MRSQQVVFDAANLHVGGGVQVASTFFYDLLNRTIRHELIERFPWLREARLIASPEVRRNLGTFLSPEELLRLEPSPPQTPPPDVTFSVFGPRFRSYRTRAHIVGFADVTLIYPWPSQLPRRSVKQVVREPLAWRAFRKADHLVVETEAVKRRLIERGLSAADVSVVPNTCNSVFRSGSSAKPRSPKGRLELLYVARAYPHKNHDFLGDVLDRLETDHGVRARVTVTLTSDEFAKRSSKFRHFAHNVGPQELAQLPKLYAQADAAVIPSLLECFSATPLEAMATGTPLLASDHDFNHTICDGAAAYFHSSNAAIAARQIKDALSDANAVQHRVSKGLEIMARWPDSLGRTTKYLEIVQEALESLG